ncbi:cell division protein ZipA [Polynucleobacter sp. MG-Unter2-18]|uniref:cell division protein ZipA C-terminal FtsZ-binding domain-containing protein n=1 Tax=Polynucleobacter sp. MG-Unter2-18 TaxID=2081052 RepID=UPI001BFDD706|nr:cell division protein ZipA C-terminal FtsZ-binding domain-containing protein [Polynucleobacter sp. MG-Unter2-18]MCF8190403.1 cell division protein ZipA [Polynucleobacter sp.]QWD93952.1 cell division protein ZipA [Polynucleobacter sp. MG-Unter2-18]
MTMLGLSDLQFALAVIGLLILILVAILNVKYARALRKAKASVEYYAAERSAREPTFGAGFADPIPGEQIEPVFKEGSLPVKVELPTFSIDPRIDCVITLRFSQPIMGSEILKEMHSWEDLSAPSSARWMCEGLNVDLDSSEPWGLLSPSSSYSELQLAIQLASRRGPIGVLELSDFCSRAQALALTLGSQIDMPSVTTMLDKAKELDFMAAESDIQLSINVLFDEAYPWNSLDSLMRQRGFILSHSGRTYEYFSNRVPIFSSNDLNPGKPVEQLTLLLELPLVSFDEKAFERMLAEGLEIAQVAHGRLADDNGINLSEISIQSIRKHLEGLYENLEKNGVPAGSSAASRLFS